MAIERQAGYGNWSSTSTVNLPSGAPVEGNLLVATGAERSGNSYTGFSLSGITGWTLAEGIDVALGDSTYRRAQAVWYKVAGASESSSVTLSNTSGNCQLTVAEFEWETGEDQWSFLDSGQNDNSTTANATSLSVSAASSTSGDQFVVAALAMKRSNSTSNTDGAWTSETLTEVNEGPTESNGIYQHVGEETFTATGTKSSTCTISGYTTNNGLSAAILVFDVVATAGGGRKSQLMTMGVS